MSGEKPPSSTPEKIQRQDEKKRGLTAREQLKYTLERGAYLLEHIAKQEEQHGIDDLTGLKTRKFLFEELERSLAGLAGGKEQRKRGFSLIFIDLDQFKQVNDTLGHAEGDRVLKKVAELMKGPMRGTDILARYGGDEFIAFLPDTSQTDAVAAAEKLRGVLVSDEELRSLGVTASLGVCSSETSTAGDAATFVDQADQAARAAKQAGKDKVEIYKGS